MSQLEKSSVTFFRFVIRRRTSICDRWCIVHYRPIRLHNGPELSVRNYSLQGICLFFHVSGTDTPLFIFLRHANTHDLNNCIAICEDRLSMLCEVSLFELDNVIWRGVYRIATRKFLITTTIMNWKDSPIQYPTGLCLIYLRNNITCRYSWCPKTLPDCTLCVLLLTC